MLLSAKTFLFTLLVFCFAGSRVLAQNSGQATTPAFVSDSLDSYIRQGMQDWQIPGLSILILKDGKVVWMKGYGVKDIVSKEPVDEHTLFMIASNSKLFTATALSQLEYDKRISLNDKITKYFPDYKLYEPATTALVSIRDLLCHRIGTKTFQGDFTFWNSRLSSEDIMRKMRLLKPETPFREDFGYCNSCFLTAGQVIPKVTGKTWRSYVRDSILTPLSMNETYTSMKEIPGGANLAKPYTTGFTGTLTQLPYDDWDNLAPAAALLSSVSDLSHWLDFQLDSGRYEGKRIMPFDILQETRDINTIISSRKSGRFPIHISGYGLGLFQEDYNGRQVFFHTGGASGMVSVLTFVPEERLAIAVLTNNDFQGFFVALRNQVLDAYLGVDYVNRSRQSFPGFSGNMTNSLQEIDQWKQAASKETTPALPMMKYAGRYTNPLYGPLDITIDKNKKNRLLVHFNGHDNLNATLDYMDKGEWLLTYNNMEYGIFKTEFRIASGGTPAVGTKKSGVGPATAGAPRVISLLTKQNDEVEYDPYMFTKE